MLLKRAQRNFSSFQNKVDKSFLLMYNPNILQKAVKEKSSPFPCGKESFRLVQESRQKRCEYIPEL